MRLRTGMVYLVLFGLILVLGCARPKPAAPEPVPPKVIAEVAAEPGQATVLFEGKPVGETPVRLPLAAFDDLLKIDARRGAEEAVEKRVRVSSEERVQVLFLFGAGRSSMAKVLGLPKILVFEYGQSPTFDVDKYDLKPEFLPLLNRQADLLGLHFKGIPVYVCGHTDITGQAAHNLKLSLERAQAVADYLASRGVPKDLLRVQGFGSDYPVGPNETPEGRSLNRRTEVVLPR